MSTNRNNLISVFYLCILLNVMYETTFTSFFFFKQKTAYELRISDWSSDVCSSDLHVLVVVRGHPLELRRRAAAQVLQPRRRRLRAGQVVLAHHAQRLAFNRRQPAVFPAPAPAPARGEQQVDVAQFAKRVGQRSEEHTSELQSLMRNPYAVFC